MAETRAHGPGARIEHLPADVLGLSPIARAALAEGPAFAPLPVARRVADVPVPEERLGAGEREALATPWRRGLEAALGGVPTRVETSLGTLLREGTACVVTGQQPGFLGSPLYSLYKALQACRLATELAREWGRPVVPVFWNHADDHDVAEVHHAWQLNRNVDLQRIALAGFSSGRTPVGDIVLDAEAQRLGAVRAQLRQTVEEHPFADEALERWFPRDGETLARALTRALTGLLGDHGLLVLEPDWLRPQLSSELGRIVSGGPLDALRRGAESLRARDLEPAIDPDTAAHAFRHDPRRGRLALRPGGDGYRYDDEGGSRTGAELGATIVGAPSEWSAGALLRPIVQDAVLPTAAYVGGWGELAYHAQLGPAREAAGVPRPPFVPRVSCTLVDDDMRFALARLEASVADVLRAGGSFAPPDDGAGAPPVVEALRAEGARIRDELRAHKAALRELEPALVASLEKAADHARNAIDKVADKAERVHRNRAGKGERHVRRVNNGLMPRGAPQERVLGPFQFHARWGDAFVRALWRELPAFAGEHVVLHLEDPEDTE